VIFSKYRIDIVSKLKSSYRIITNAHCCYSDKNALFVERQEERLKTNNRDLSMASDMLKMLLRFFLLFSLSSYHHPLYILYI